MDGYLKYQTAVTVPLGKYVDATDGVTVEAGLTITQADVLLSKNGAALAQKHEASNATYDTAGWYRCPFDTTDTGTLGPLKIEASMAGACPVYHNFMVVRADVYDSMFGTDYLQVDVIQVGSDTQSGTDLKDFADTGYDPATHDMPTMVDSILNEALAGHSTADSVGLAIKNLLKIGKNKIAYSGTSLIIYDDDNTTPLYSFTLDSATAPTSRVPV